MARARLWGVEAHHKDGPWVDVGGLEAVLRLVGENTGKETGGGCQRGE
jgi:hypothetical protein